MQLQDAIHIYLVCIVAEGLSEPIASKYRYALCTFLDIVDDMDVAALNRHHVQRFLSDIPIQEPNELRKCVGVLRFFRDWVRAQSQVRPLANRYDPNRKPSGWKLITPRQLAVKRKLPLAL